jgi:hypothetical protein
MPGADPYKDPKTMLLPSGAHTGEVLWPGSEVSRDAVPRSRSFTQTFPSTGLMYIENAKRFPSGEKRGEK